MITKADVQHIANLARIALTPEEEERFAGELSAILDFVGELNQVDTTGVLPVNGGGELVNVMREDAAENDVLEGRAARLLEAVAERKDDWVKVKAVF